MISHATARRAGAVAFAAVAAWACTSGPTTSADGSAAAAGPGEAVTLALAETAPTVGSGARGEILVQVNGTPVTRAEVDERIDAFVGPQLAMVPPEQREQVRSQLSGRVLDEMIVKTLLSQAADRQQIAVSDEEVASSIREIGTKLPEGKTVADYLEHLGMTEAELNREIATELRIGKLLDQETAVAFEPTEPEVTRFYTENIDRFQLPERVRARHVLIAVTPGDDDAAKAAKRAKAETLQKQLASDAGASFAAMAAEESDCPSKAQGGDLGEFARGQMDAVFEQAAFGQKVGEVGPVVETPFGFHVIQVQEHHDAGTVELAEAKAVIVDQLAAQKKQAAVQSYIEGLRAEAKIVYPEAAAA